MNPFDAVFWSGVCLGAVATFAVILLAAQLHGARHDR